MEGTRILMIATYGMEIVECGGALAKNVQAGGESYAAVVLAREESRPFVLKASEVLGVKTQFLDFRFGEVGPDVPSKLKLVKVIRAIRPDIIICQEPEHSFDDLDPDRRQAMILYLESIALASRDWELDKTPGLKPHPVPTIYYMTPHEPNCILDVAPVWHLKEQAMAQLRTQMAFSAQILRGRVGEEAVQALLGEAAHHAAPVYCGNTNLFASVWRIVCARDLQATLHWGEPDAAQGRDRRAWAESLRTEIGRLADQPLLPRTGEPPRWQKTPDRSDQKTA